MSKKTYDRAQSYQPRTVKGCEKVSDPWWERAGKWWKCLVDECGQDFLNKPLLCGHRVKQHGLKKKVAFIPIQPPGRRPSIKDEDELVPQKLPKGKKNKFNK